VRAGGLLWCSVVRNQSTPPPRNTQAIGTTTAALVPSQQARDPPRPHHVLQWGALLGAWRPSMAGARYLRVCIQSTPPPRTTQATGAALVALDVPQQARDPLVPPPLAVAAGMVLGGSGRRMACVCPLRMRNQSTPPPRTTQPTGVAGAALRPLQQPLMLSHAPDCAAAAPQVLGPSRPQTARVHSLLACNQPTPPARTTQATGVAAAALGPSQEARGPLTPPPRAATLAHVLGPSRPQMACIRSLRACIQPAPPLRTMQATGVAGAALGASQQARDPLGLPRAHTTCCDDGQGCGSLAPSHGTRALALGGQSVRTTPTDHAGDWCGPGGCRAVTAGLRPPRAPPHVLRCRLELWGPRAVARHPVAL